jgi:integrase
MVDNYPLTFFDDTEQRLFLSPEEYRSFICFTESNRDHRFSFCYVIAHTGCRVLEALALRRSDFDFSGDAVLFGVNDPSPRRAVRSVPVPHDLLEYLDSVYRIRPMQRPRARRKNPPLWSFTRETGYRKVTRLLNDAGIFGPQATPRGLRYGYALNEIICGTPALTVALWMGQPPEAARCYEELIKHKLRDS